MANKLTSEGLTVGASTLTNIIRDWGGGSIFSGFGMISNDGTEVENLPAIGVGQYKYCYVPGSNPYGDAHSYNIYLPSGGQYQWVVALAGSRINVGPGGIPNDYSDRCGVSSGGTRIFRMNDISNPRITVCYLRIS